jgi:hypothetical protein
MTMTIIRGSVSVVLPVSRAGAHNRHRTTESEERWPMVKMTPEQEAAYALDFGVPRSDLPEDAQLAYDRLAEQRTRAGTPAPVSPADAEAASRRVTMPKWAAVVGTALSFPMGPGVLVVLLPWLITHWQAGAPYPLAVRAVGVVLIAAAAS